MRSFLQSALGALLMTAAVLTARGDAQQTQTPPDQQPPAGQQGQQPAAGQQPTTPTFRAGINFVRVDVIVSDRSGGAVSDLKQSDFEVIEDGKPQTIEAFRLIKLDGGTTPTAEGPPRQIRTDA